MLSTNAFRRTTVIFLLIVSVSGRSEAAPERKERRSEKRSEKARTELPTRAKRYSPSGAKEAFVVTQVDVSRIASFGRRESPDELDPSTLKEIFEDAIFFPLERGARIVPDSRELKIDYIEIRSDGRGFSVGAETTGTTNLSISRFEVSQESAKTTTGPVEVQMDVELNIEEAAPVADAARLRMRAEYFGRLERSAAFISEEEEAEEKEEDKESSKDEEGESQDSEEANDADEE